MSGRSAANDISAISRMRSSEMGPTAGMNSSVVPGWSRTAAASATNSSKVAEREGTGRPSPSVWPSPSEDEKPKAPPDSDSSTKAAMASICSFEADPRVASEPITARRTVECPTRNPALTARPSIDPIQVLIERGPVPGARILHGAERNSLDDSHHPLDVVASPGANGAIENPQLPPRTVVTPWRTEGLAVVSHSNWAS